MSALSISPEVLDLGNDGEEIKKIAGKGISKSGNKTESDDLILHLVSTSLSNIHEKWEFLQLSIHIFSKVGVM